MIKVNNVIGILFCALMISGCATPRKITPLIGNQIKDGTRQEEVFSYLGQPLRVKKWTKDGGKLNETVIYEECVFRGRAHEFSNAVMRVMTFGLFGKAKVNIYEFEFEDGVIKKITGQPNLFTTSINVGVDLFNKKEPTA